MTARKPETTETETSNTDAETPNSDATTPENAFGAAVADTAAAGAAETLGIEGATGDPIASTVTIVGDETELSEHLADLKAIGNANPDVNVVAVQSAHGTWTWTARAAVDDRKLAAGGPHHATRLVENLKLLLGGSTIALLSTGSDTVHKLA